MLWQKESNGDGALYIDILKNTSHPLGNFHSYRDKSNAQSLRLRTEGNRKFAQNDIDGAMELYNQSICFAENGSEHLGLAYANRSSCFLRLQMYDRCVVDIQMAKAANYPKRLMAKLDDRHGECLKRKSTDVAITIATPEPRLSYDADKKLPCMANVLAIEKNGQFGRLIRANRDIEIGEIEQLRLSIVPRKK